MTNFFVFVFGAIIGSFLNVVILRHNTGKSIVRDRSQCFSCGKKLGWYELLPIVSFVLQRGKCRGCKSKISWQYPLVELATGALFTLVTWKLGFQVEGFTLYSLFSIAYFITIVSLLIVIAVYDFRHQIIPDKFVYSFDFLAFFAVFLKINSWKFFGNWKLIVGNLGASILAGFVFFIFFAALWFFSKGRAMGFGDAKLALGMGFFLGLKEGFLALLLSFWIGAVVGIFLLFLARKRYNMKSKIAFGPFIVLAIMLVFLFGETIVRYIAIL